MGMDGEQQSREAHGAGLFAAALCVAFTTFAVLASSVSTPFL
jgi:hypothetical protein